MIKIKTEREIELMRQGGKILAFVLGKVAQAVKPGVTTQSLNDLAEKLIAQSGAAPAFLGHDGYPASLCTSVNEEIVHAIPSNRVLREGDILGLDLGILWPPEKCGACPLSRGCGGQRGLNTDMAITVPVGRVSPEAQKLIDVAAGALNAAVAKIKPGRKLSEISKEIQRYVEKSGLTVIRELIGHGIGYDLHEEPDIPNYHADWLKDAVLKEGMVLALEPMVSSGGWKIKKSKDKHGYETADKSLSAHFEHTVAVTDRGAEILTRF